MLRYARSDRELKEDFQKILWRMVSTRPGDEADYLVIRAKLIQSQFSWKRFRDNDCWTKFELQREITSKKQTELECLIRLTEQRESDLAKWSKAR